MIFPIQITVSIFFRSLTFRVYCILNAIEQKTGWGWLRAWWALLISVVSLEVPGGKKRVPVSCCSVTGIRRTPGAMYQRSTTQLARDTWSTKASEWWPLNTEMVTTMGVWTSFFLILGAKVLSAQTLWMDVWKGSPAQRTHLRPGLLPGTGLRLQSRPMGSTPRYEPPTLQSSAAVKQKFQLGIHCRHLQTQSLSHPRTIYAPRRIGHVVTTGFPPVSVFRAVEGVEGHGGTRRDILDQDDKLLIHQRSGRMDGQLHPRETVVHPNLLDKRTNE